MSSGSTTDVDMSAQVSRDARTFSKDRGAPASAIERDPVLVAFSASHALSAASAAASSTSSVAKASPIGAAAAVAVETDAAAILSTEWKMDGRLADLAVALARPAWAHVRSLARNLAAVGVQVRPMPFEQLSVAVLRDVAPWVPVLHAPSGSSTCTDRSDTDARGGAASAFCIVTLDGAGLGVGAAIAADLEALRAATEMGERAGRGWVRGRQPDDTLTMLLRVLVDSKQVWGGESSSFACLLTDPSCAAHFDAREQAIAKRDGRAPRTAGQVIAACMEPGETRLRVCIMHSTAEPAPDMDDLGLPSLASATLALLQHAARLTRASTSVDRV